MLLKYACVWNSACKSFLPRFFCIVQGFHGGFLLAFHLCSSHQQYDIGQKWLCRQELALGRQRWSANMIPWQQAAAVISGYACKGLHFLKLFWSWLSKEKEIKALVLPALLHSHSQPGLFSLSLTRLSQSEVRKWGTAWPQELKAWREKLYLDISFLCLPQGGFWSSLWKGNLPLPSLRCGLPFPLILHRGGAVLLVLLSLICLSMPKLGTSWLVGNVAQVKGQALVFVSKCCI